MATFCIFIFQFVICNCKWSVRLLAQFFSLVIWPQKLAAPTPGVSFAGLNVIKVLLKLIVRFTCCAVRCENLFKVFYFILRNIKN